MLDTVFERLLQRYGPQEWWPAEDPFEVAVGAVLTQGTAWTNAATAIAALKHGNGHRPGSIAAIPDAELAARIRPAGFHNVKAARLKALAAWWLERGGPDGVAGVETNILRSELLRVHGIGRETADAILLYAFGRRVFVVDAYLRRLFARLGRVGGREPYDDLRRLFEHGFSGGAGGCNEYHALIIEHGKTHCRSRPACEGCCLSSICAFRFGSPVAGNGRR